MEKISDVKEMMLYLISEARETGSEMIPFFYVIAIYVVIQTPIIVLYNIILVKYLGYLM